MTALTIVNRLPSEPLARHAAAELQRYVRRLFGFQPPVAQTEETDAPLVVVLEGEDRGGLSPQGYRLQTGSRRGGATLRIAGGSPRAILWGAYELVSAWGVHFLVQGDVWPERAGELRLPALEGVREPVFRRRDFRIINDMANSGVYWSLAQHQQLFDQLAKLRFSGVFVSTYHHQPWVHYAFRGIERRDADLCYGFQHRLHAGSIGRERFADAAVGDDGSFTNPDLRGAATYEDRLARASRLMHGIIAAAHARGLEVSYSVNLGDPPPAILRHLPELSAGVELPPAAAGAQHAHRIGLEQVGGEPEAVRYCTPLNPVYVELVESMVAAHLEAYPEIDRLVLWETEFPPSGAGVEACWQELDRKYRLAEVRPLADIVARASSQFFYEEGRALRQAYGAIQTLRLLDILINERRIVRPGGSPGRVGVSVFSEHIQPLVSRVLPADVADFVAVVDYLPARVAERMHTLEFARTSPVPVSMITTVEDDNVGFLPQLTAPALHQTVVRMREYGIAGYCFRQFDISAHEPTMAYLAEAGWDPAATPERTYRRYATGVAGAAASDDLVAALRAVEQLSAGSDALMGLGFLMPGIYLAHWTQEGTVPVPEWRTYLERFAPIEARLAAALDRAETRGRALVAGWRDFIAFGRLFVETLDLIRRARAEYDAAATARREGDVRAFDRRLGESAALLEQALGRSEAALRTWARRAVDQTDLGTLAALNAYGHDWLRGIALQVHWESQYYGFTVAAPPTPSPG